MGVVAVAEIAAQRDEVLALAPAFDPDVVSAAGCRVLVDDTTRMINALSGLRAKAAAKVACTSLATESGAKTAANDLAARVGTSTGEAQKALALGERLRDQPTLAGADAGGEVSLAQAALIADAAAANPTAEQDLVARAKTESLEGLEDACERAKRAADADPVATQARVHAARRWRMWTDDDIARYFGESTKAQLVNIRAAIDAKTDELFKAAYADGRREPREAYAMDALHAICTDWLDGDGHRADEHGDEHDDADDGDVADVAHDDEPDVDDREVDRAAGPSERPPEGVLAGADDAEHDRDEAADRTRFAPDANAPPGRRARAGPVPRGRPPDRSGKAKRRKRTRPARVIGIVRIDASDLRKPDTAPPDPDAVCEIDGIGPVDRATARALLGDALLYLVITDGTAVRNVVNLSRQPTVAQQVALAWESAGACRITACSSPRLHIHHREHWSDTHHTVPDELERYCEHHHELHHKGWTTHEHPDGSITMRPPER